MEYGGIYVGTFAAVAGAIGLWSSVITVSVDKEQTFYWSNLAIQCFCVANSIALLGASIAMMLKHSAEHTRADAPYDRHTLVQLKTAVFVLHIFLIIFAMSLLVIMTLRRRQTMGTNVRNKI